MSSILEVINVHINDLNFINRPIHISYKYRVIFQVSRVILILGTSSSKKGSSILKIQVISDALENEELFEYLEWLIDNDVQGFVKSWRYNPLLSRAVSYSNADGLTKYNSKGKLVLTEKGEVLYNEICQEKEVLLYEKNQLLKIKKKLSDTKLLSVLEKGSI